MAEQFTIPRQFKEKSNQHIHDRTQFPPQISRAMGRSVSDFRRDGLEYEVDQGKFIEGSPYNKYNSGPIVTGAGTVLGSLSKKATVTSSSGASWRGAGGTLTQTPEIYSPLWLTSNLNLPRDRATINAWSRAFFAMNPFVHNSISLHSTYPISKLMIKCKDKRVEKFFAEMIEEIDLMNVCCQIAQEFWLLGEAFVYATLDEGNAKWSHLTIQNPDYVVVNHSVSVGEPQISLRPDENLKKIVNGSRPTDAQQRNMLDPTIIDYVKRGQNIPLNNLYVSHLVRRISPYEPRGTGLPVTIFKQLMLFDRIREAKHAQSVNMINPLTLVKIGGPDFKPQPVDLEQWRDVFAQAQADPDFKIFCHDAVTVERVGHNAGILDTSNDITQLIKEIYIGLMVPSVIMDGGADTTYANGGVALDILRQRYLQFRNMMTAWLRRKIFAPICQINDFFDYSSGEKVLIVPDVDWNYMSLFDAGDYIQTMLQLTAPEQKRASVQSLYRSLGLDGEDEKRKIRNEAIQEAILAKEKEALAGMTLNDLRALKDEDEIKESNKPEQPVPGEVSLPGVPGPMPGPEGVPPPPTGPETPPPPGQ